jgi:alkanesulfonate monooxygenase SsuD/methylene tetrahydromethanopterin reductase-like flavin-dependent oxidoreductase (luciferase family)
VLLRLHRPFAVAERFALLSRLYPGRVDLGIARGGADPVTEIALLDGHRLDADDESGFASRVARLVAALRGELPPPLVPAPGELAVWLLGRSVTSASIATALGLPYCHALFLGEAEPPPRGTAALAVAGVCGRTATAAEKLLSGRPHTFIRPGIVGDPRRCAAALRALADRHGVNEVLFCDLCDEPSAHLESYLLLADALDTSGPES